MKKEKNFYRINIDQIEAGTDEPRLLREVTEKLQAIHPGMIELEIQRIDLLDGKAMVYYSKPRPTTATTARAVAEEALLAGDEVMIREEEVWALE